jgi:hypothetical protein
MTRSRTKWENTASAIASVTLRPLDKKSAANATDHTSDIAREWDQSMQSRENPGDTPGVMDTPLETSEDKRAKEYVQKAHAQSQPPSRR